MKISQLPKATAVTDSDIAVIVQDGETRQIPRKLLAPNPDWQQNDAEKPDYIRNRPFYKEQTIVDYVELFSAEIDSDTGLGLYGKKLGLEVGHTYAVDYILHTGETITSACKCVDAMEAIEQATDKDIDEVLPMLANTDYIFSVYDGAIVMPGEIAAADNAMYTWNTDIISTVVIHGIESTKEVIRKIPNEFLDRDFVRSVIPKPTVDAELSETSENPVQNKAVTAALSELEGKAKYRVIADITLTEDTQKIEITKDDSGNPFSLKSVFILFRGTFTQTADYNMHFTFNGGLIYQMYSKFSATAGRYYGLWARSERIGTFKTGNDTLSIWQSTYPQSLCTNFLDNGTGQGLSGNNTALKGDICARFYHTATNVRFGCYTADNLMAAGSNILIVGVDDNG